jgi:hypothetical protein
LGTTIHTHKQTLSLSLGLSLSLSVYIYMYIYIYCEMLVFSFVLLGPLNYAELIIDIIIADAGGVD